MTKINHNGFEHKYIQGRCFIKAVKLFIGDEPLDGDETEAITKRFGIELDYANGNISDSEYEKAVKHD